MMHVLAQEVLEGGGTLSWFAAAGGIAGILALVGGGVVLGRFANRMDSAETAIRERPTSAEMKAELRSLGKSIDSVRDDVREVREILLNNSGRRG